LLIIRLGPDATVKTLDGLHVVIENVGTGIQHAGNRVHAAAKIRRQHFHTGLRKGAANLAHCFGKMPGSTVLKIIAINRRHHDVTKVQIRRHACDVGGLIRIELKLLLGRRSFGHRAESTTARTQIAENHEGRRAAMKAFVQVGAAGRLADGMQVQSPQFCFERVYFLKMGTVLT
jgi:hypothetical protein